MSGDHNMYQKDMPVVKDGGPAFPQKTDMTLSYSGMTLRDYFAAKAMQGCLAYSHVNPQWGNYHENCEPEQVAVMAYILADAMLKARGQ